MSYVSALESSSTTSLPPLSASPQSIHIVYTLQSRHTIEDVATPVLQGRPPSSNNLEVRTSSEHFLHTSGLLLHIPIAIHKGVSSSTIYLVSNVCPLSFIFLCADISNVGGFYCDSSFLC